MVCKPRDRGLFVAILGFCLLKQNYLNLIVIPKQFPYFHQSHELSQKNGGSYVLVDKTPIQLQTGLYLLFCKPWTPNVNCFGLNEKLSKQTVMAPNNWVRLLGTSEKYLRKQCKITVGQLGQVRLENKNIPIPKNASLVIYAKNCFSGSPYREKKNFGQKLLFCLSPNHDKVMFYCIFKSKFSQI